MTSGCLQCEQCQEGGTPSRPTQTDSATAALASASGFQTLPLGGDRREVSKIPARMRVQVQVDSGTSPSAFDPKIFQHLDIRPIDKIKVFTTSSGSEPAEFNLFAVSIGLEEAG